MAIKVKAVERKLKVGKDAGQYRYMMQAEIYNTLNAQKVISEASVRSGIQEGALSAAWDAIGRVIKVWATEGHSIAIPGLGRMRFGVRATSVGDVNKVSTSLITARRVIFSPSVEIKDELSTLPAAFFTTIPSRAPTIAAAASFCSSVTASRASTSAFAASSTGFNSLRSPRASFSSGFISGSSS